MQAWILYFEKIDFYLNKHFIPECFQSSFIHSFRTLFQMDFKYGYESTSLDKIIHILQEKETSVIVFDTHYGTTFSLSNLKKTDRIENLKISREDSSENMLIESYPRLFMPDSENLKIISEHDSFRSIYFIPIRHHFVVKNGTFYKIPYNFYEIAQK